MAPCQKLEEYVATSDTDILEAFRKATGWSDERALHYAGCDLCMPMEGMDCSNAPYVEP